MEKRVLYKTELQREEKNKFFNELSKFNLPSCITSFFDTVRSVNSKKTYWNVIKNFLEWKYGDLHKITRDDIKELRATDINRYMDEIVENGNFSPSSVNIKISTLMSFCKHLYQDGVQEKNLADFVKTKSYKTKIKRNQAKMPTISEIKGLEKSLQKIKDPFVRARYLLIFDIFKTIGLRLNELVGLDLQDLYLNVMDERTGEECSYILCLRKGSYAETQMEKVYLSDKLVKEIKDWLVIRKFIIDTTLVQTDALFINNSAERVSYKTIQQMFEKHSNKTITPHMLRHYASTMMLKKTNDLSFVQEQLGHEIGSTVTMGTYVAGLEESRRKMKNM